MHSSMPYSDRYAEKQAKLFRLKANRKHILDRCEKLLFTKLKKDMLLTEAKQSRDKIDLLRLAIEQRRNNIEEKKKQLLEVKNYNSELSLKLPRYQKRVSCLGKHAQVQSMELQNKISTYNEQAEALAALRRSRIRQLTKYIFPVYMTYDTSDSIEDMEFIGDDIEEDPPKRSHLHIVAPWINTDGDYSHVSAWINQNKEVAQVVEPTQNPAYRTSAALGLAAQLIALLAWTIDMRLPHALSLNEYCVWRVCEGGLRWRQRRAGACSAALALRAGVARWLYAHAPSRSHTHAHAHPPHNMPSRSHALTTLHHLAVAANVDDPMLGRVEPWLSVSEAMAGEAWAELWAEAEADADAEAEADHDDAEPEHLHWPETMEMEEVGGSPPSLPPAPPAPSLVTSAAASLASVWRVFTK